jgi:hypothetical protein
MKTRTGYPAPRLEIRTDLRAGDFCKPWDTNCVMVNEQGQAVALAGASAPLFSTCNQGFPGAGAACVTMLEGLRGRMPGATPNLGGPNMKLPGVSCRQC